MSGAQGQAAAPPAPADALRAATGSAGPLFATGNRTRLGAATDLFLDPAARIGGSWNCPRGRLLSLETEVAVPGAWFALHLPLHLPDPDGFRWIVLTARTSAAAAIVVRPCLRSGLPGGGFHDLFFDRHMLGHLAESDHVDMIAPDRQPDFARDAPWRELVLFLPPATSFAWTLHDLRIATL